MDKEKLKQIIENTQKIISARQGSTNNPKKRGMKIEGSHLESIAESIKNAQSKKQKL